MTHEEDTKKFIEYGLNHAHKPFVFALTYFRRPNGAYRILKSRIEGPSFFDNRQQTIESICATMMIEASEQHPDAEMSFVLLAIVREGAEPETIIRWINNAANALAYKHDPEDIGIAEETFPCSNSENN